MNGLERKGLNLAGLRIPDLPRREKRTNGDKIVGYPYSLYQDLRAEGKDTEQIALDTLKIGILGDRGHLVRRIADDTVLVGVEDVEPLLCAEIAQQIKASDSLVRFIALGKNRLPLEPTANQVNRWYLQAARIYTQLLGSSDMALQINTSDGPNSTSQTFDLSPDGIMQAWVSAGMPLLTITGGYTLRSVSIT